MKYLIVLFSLITFSLFGQSGIEPSSFQGTPYKGGVMVGVIPIIDEFTGDTTYLYQHSDTSFVKIDSLVYTDSLRLYTSQGVFTTYIASGGVDSTNVLNSYGTIINESPANTFNIKVDSSKFFTIYDGNLKQDLLVSGTNIKTFNSGSLLGSGNVTSLTSLNSLTASTQTFSTGTTGTDFNIASSGSTHTLNLPTASGSNRGLLSNANWTTFNNKLDPSTTFGPDVTGTYNNLRGKYMQWNADLGLDANVFSNGKFTFRYCNVNVATPGNVTSILEVPLNGSYRNWQIGSRMADDILRFRNNNDASGLTGGTWQELFSTLNLPNGLKYAADLSLNFNTNPSDNTQAIRYAYANTNSPDGNTYDGLDIRRNNNTGWQIARNGASRLYTRGRNSGSWGSWEEIPTISTGTAITLYGLSSANKLVPLTLGTGLSISSGTLNGPSIPETWANISNHIVSWGSTGTFGSGYPVAVGVTSATQDVDINGHIRLRGAIYSGATNSSGSIGQVLTSQGAGNPWIWAAPSAGAFTVAATTGSSQVITTDGSPLITYAAGTNMSTVLTGTTSPTITFNSNVAHGMMIQNSSTGLTLDVSLRKVPFSSAAITNKVTFSDANDRISVTETGTYEITYSLTLGVTASPYVGFFECQVHKNGASVSESGECIVANYENSGNNRTVISKTLFETMTSGQYIELFYGNATITSTCGIYNATLTIKRIN